MPKIGTNQLQNLRSWLFPQAAGEGTAPKDVGDILVPTISVESYERDPQFEAVAVSPQPGPGLHAAINFEMFDATSPSGFRPVKFTVADFEVRTRSPVVVVASRNARLVNLGIPSTWQGLANLTEVATQYLTFHGDQNQVTIQTGNTPGALIGNGPQIVANDWERLPDVSAGQCIQFANNTVDQAVTMEFRWRELRPIGVPAF